MKRTIYLILGIFLLSGCSGISGASYEYSQTEMFMGTFVQVKLVEPGYSKEDLKNISDKVFKKALEFEKIFNVFDPASEINALNIAKELSVSRELFKLIEKSIQISRVTNGAFDITVAPALKAEGFYKDMPEELLEKIPDEFDGISWESLTLDPDTRTVTLNDNAWLDLSGIAKGYIVDRMVEDLREEGIAIFLINAGGDIYCGGKGDDGSWRVGVRDPASDRGDVTVLLGVKMMAVATSGDYENVVLSEGASRPSSHIINPALGKAIKDASSSVTVIAPTCYEADALATGMMVMEKRAAIELANTMANIEIVVVESENIPEKISFSGGMSKYILEK